MADKNIDKLERKKKELEEELEHLQQELDGSIDQVRDDVSSSLAPSEIIRKHPLPAVGLSVLIGFLAGNRKSRNSSGTSGHGVTAVLWDELKKIGTKKAISLFTDYTEQLLMDKRDEMINSSDKGKKGE